VAAARLAVDRTIGPSHSFSPVGACPLLFDADIAIDIVL
jgi:hypothetical protein